MKIKFTKSFIDKLDKQIDYIAKDKPEAARIFKTDLLAKIEKILSIPFKNRKSVFFDREDIRDLIFKGYVTVYKVNEEKGLIEVFEL